VFEVDRILTITNLNAWETFGVELSDNFFFIRQTRNLPNTSAKFFSIAEVSSDPRTCENVAIGAEIDVVFLDPNLNPPIGVEHKPLRVIVLAHLYLDFISEVRRHIEPLGLVLVA